MATKRFRDQYRYVMCKPHVFESEIPTKFPLSPEGQVLSTWPMALPVYCVHATRLNNHELLVWTYVRTIPLILIASVVYY